MRALIFGLSLLGLPFAPTPASSQLSADLSVEILEPIPDVTPPGSSGVFSFQITNLGPDSAGGSGLELPISIGTNLIDFNIGEGPDFFFIEQTMSSDCLVVQGNIDPIPGNPPQVFYSAFFPPLDPGETAFCEVNYFVSSNIEESKWVTWELYGLDEEDPDLANNRFRQFYRIAAPPPIPTLTPAGVAAFVLTIFAVYVALRRWSG